MTHHTKRRTLANLCREVEERQTQGTEDQRVAASCRDLIDFVYPIVAAAVRGGAAALEPLLPTELIARTRTLRSLLYVAVSGGHCHTCDRTADAIAAQLDWLTGEQQQAEEGGTAS